MGEQPNISEAQLRTVMNARRLFRRSLTTISAMSTSAATSSPFSNAVVGAMRKLYPEALADKSCDNTGLLLEAPERSNARLARSALLTIDLTQAVAEEAIKGQHSIVISYHPIIFRALKSLTLANTQQNSLLRLASEGISVYSPHTAVDAAPGGLNDWLADIIMMTSEHTSEHTRKIINTVPNLANLPDQLSSNASRKASQPPPIPRSKPAYLSPSLRNTCPDRGLIFPSKPLGYVLDQAVRCSTG